MKPRMLMVAGIITALALGAGTASAQGVNLVNDRSGLVIVFKDVSSYYVAAQLVAAGAATTEAGRRTLAPLYVCIAPSNTRATLLASGDPLSLVVVTEGLQARCQGYVLNEAIRKCGTC